ncbi:MULTISPECIES: hypothetical protein [Chryseobacterium]|uniref:Uncharacterized protein n=1 Tax=Chryseobacterium taihuense TaxID=1141221 RepID=A0A4V6IDN4_9FLAO|nr:MULTISPECIES: hypothetical protein [Chryseobacterium]QQV02581.1 hypothetical protein I6I61_16190 [Chryseobacterium sp. FDAARGOS 1104]VFB04164.1 Uncharacterised protein [Chryseobacterium taihuense]
MNRDTKIENKEAKGFWIDIADVEVLSHFILQSFEENNAQQKNRTFEYIYNQLLWNREGFQYDTTDIALEKILEVDEITLMLKILTDTKCIIEKQGEMITPDFINSLNKFRGKNEQWNWSKPIYTSSFIKVLDIMILMLKNEWQETDKRIWLKGHAPEGFEET